MDLPSAKASAGSGRQSEFRLTCRCARTCLDELFDPRNPRYGYPYINCTNCGPRYTVVLGLPYDRGNTTMKDWPLDDYCAEEFRDRGQPPLSCAARSVSGVRAQLLSAAAGKDQLPGTESAIHHAAELLSAGKIVAVKGLGGYHLACDARNPAAVAALRERKYRKEKPFAVMARDLDEARRLVELSSNSETLLTSAARPIVLAPAKAELIGVAPQNNELGVMLPYTPLASSAVCRGRAASSGHDQRQPLE